LKIDVRSTIDDNKIIQVPQFIVCTNLNTLIDRIYLGTGNPRVQDDQYFLEHIILCSRNDEMHNINKAILQQFNPVLNIEAYMLRSVDSVSEKDRMYYVYPVEFLQQLNSSRLPSALLCLKVGCLVILLRNLDPEGLGNRTRMVVLNVRKKVLQYRIISKYKRFREKIILILGIRLSSNTDILSVPLKRLLFPVRLIFAMTINKSQEQLVEHMGINLQILVFFHGQLYIMFSRYTLPFNISVKIQT